jgi:hypothetical protein
VLPRFLLGQQMTKSADGAVTGINRLSQAEVCHLSLECFCPKPAPFQPASEIVQTALAMIKAYHVVAARGQLDD